MISAVPFDQQPNARKRKRERKAEVKALPMEIHEMDLESCISKKSKSGYKGTRMTRDTPHLCLGFRSHR